MIGIAQLLNIQKILKWKKGKDWWNKNFYDDNDDDDNNIKTITHIGKN